MSSHQERLELLAVETSDGIQLVSPAVGLFTRAAARGRALVAGEEAGVLVRLGRRASLIVPAGVAGLVTNPPPLAVQAPVGAGDVLYVLSALAGAGADSAGAAGPRGAAESDGLVLRAPQTGRFYHRSAPGDPPYVAVGDVVEDGRPVGLIEVMKTFTHVAYRAHAGLPARARITAIHAADGTDVTEGDALLSVEPA